MYRTYAPSILLLVSMFTLLSKFSQAAGTDTIAYTPPASFCKGANKILTLNNLPQGAATQWFFNGTKLSGATGSQLTATTAGTYTAEVTASNIKTDYGPLTLEEAALPDAGFTWPGGNLCMSSAVRFTSAASGSGLTYEWDFGDPASGNKNTSSEKNPGHQFVGDRQGLQKFTVKLTVRTKEGCSSTKSAEISMYRADASLGGPEYDIREATRYFVSCVSSGAEATHTFFMQNISATKVGNTGYRIDWGDGSTPYSSATLDTISHTYHTGLYTLKFTVTNSNGCSETENYTIFYGSTPAVGLNTPGNTIICAGSELRFPVTGIAGNAPGTIYTVNYGDGTTETYNRDNPPPDTLVHTFNKGSYGSYGGNYYNAFMVSIAASNPCNTSQASVGPIYVSHKAEADFSVSPSDTVCVASQVTFTDLKPATYVVGSNTTRKAARTWKILPSTGWTIASGSTGSDNNSGNPVQWTSGTENLNIRFAAPGTYTITLKKGNGSCGTDTMSKTICVNPVPAAAFSPDTTTGCAPFKVKMNNNSPAPVCGSNRYRWTVSYSNTGNCPQGAQDYSFGDNTTETSANPVFLFRKPGQYTIKLQATSPGGSCTSQISSQTITVKAPPSATLRQAAAICAGQSFTPNATVNSCYSPERYEWSFPGGFPAVSTSSSPGAVRYDTAGIHTYTLKVINDCGETTVSGTITVKPLPDVSPSAALSYCAGETVPAINFTSSQPGTQFIWTSDNTLTGITRSSGNGPIPSFTARNTGSAPVVTTITVTPQLNGCTGNPETFTITVHPKPAPPQSAPSLSYCQGETAPPLSATAAPGHTLTWYISSTSVPGSQTAPRPDTQAPGTYQFYVTQSNGNCSSAPAAITVTIYPVISSNTIGSSQTICYNTPPAPLGSQGSSPGGGNGFYSYQWQQSSGNGTWDDIPAANQASFSPGPLSATRSYHRVVSSGNCSSTSNEITVTVQGELSNYQAGSDQTICENTAPAELTGQTPLGGNGAFTFQWESSANGNIWTTIPNAAGSNYQPSPLTADTWYRRRVNSASCTAWSDPVHITVIPTPVITGLSDLTVCDQTPVNAIPFHSNGSATVYTWQNDQPGTGLAAQGTGSSLPAFTAVNNLKEPLTATIQITPVYSNNGLTCSGNPAIFRITVLPHISIHPIGSQNTCSGNVLPALTPVTDATNYPGASVSFNWKVSGPGITLTNGSGPEIPPFSAVNNGSTDLTATITVTPVYHYNGYQCTGASQSYQIMVKPQPAVSAGADVTLCNQTAYALDASIPPPGAAGQWSVSGDPGSTRFEPGNSDPKATITGLRPGTMYHLVWTVTGNLCSPVTSRVTITNLAPLSNTISTATPVICHGQTVVVSGSLPTGGDGKYSYQWYSSPDGNNWTQVSNSNTKDLTTRFSTSAYLKREIRSSACSLESASLYITVQPPLAGNIISSDLSICTGTTPAALTGSLPTGADGIYYYQWQQNTGQQAWQDIAGAHDRDFQPPALTQTTWYRRIITSALCNGPQSDTSNAVQYTVNPDSKAEFSASSQRGCTPFDLKTVITSIPHPDRNANYEWFANGHSIGTGASFPGYTLTSGGDTVTITLKTTSRYGCRPDSASRTFTTVKSVTASFTKDQIRGCGPLTVAFTNTSLNIADAGWRWDFGNGQTADGPSSPPVTFAPHPQHRDTTYIITLTATTDCRQSIFTDSVTVRSAPLATFSPDKTVGCSPMKVVFTNQSQGMPNRYTVKFGNGDSLTVADNSPFSYTYHTAKLDTFTVKLIAENECGKDSSTYDIVVFPNEIIAELVVNGSNKAGCAPLTVTFDNNTTGASSFAWDFGDGTTLTTDASPSRQVHTYTRPGIYNVVLKASNGCSDTSTTETIRVYRQPAAAFWYPGLQHCVNDSVTFINQSAGSNGSLWDFGDGTTSDLQHPVHAWQRPGKYTVTLTTIETYADGTRCGNAVSKEIEIIPSPVALFTSNAGTLNCAPFNLTVSTTPANAVSVEWDFGDPSGAGNQITGYNASHFYSHPGVYRVRAIAYNANGCTDSTIQIVRITERPSAAFTTPDTVFCGPSATVTFTNQSSYQQSGLLSYQWYVNNSRVSVQKDLQYTFTTPASTVLPYVYEIKLLVTAPAGCTDTVIHHVQFNPLPEAAFTTAVNAACAPYRVEIQNQSKYATSYRWYLNGQEVSSEAIPRDIVLPNPATTYTLILVAENQYGCRPDTAIHQLSTWPRPTASFTLADSVSCNGLLDITVTNTSRGATSYTWNFGDGSQPYTGVIPHHSYTHEGSYTLQLIAHNDHCSDTASKTINITVKPRASFIANARNGCRTLEVQFQNDSDEADSYLWDFGDGTFSGSRHPVHRFNYLKSPYTVKLIAYGRYGCADTAVLVNYITVSAPPESNFDVLPDTLIKIPDYTFSFRNTSKGSPVRYQWSFGDGKYSAEENPSHTYADTGAYKVRLISTNREGCTDTLTKTIYILGIPGYLYVPNAFEPGHVKTKLKFFRPEGSGMTEYHLRIFNRWGELVWQSSTLDMNGAPAEGWDGTFRGQPAPQGVYIWDISARFIDGTEWKGMKYPDSALRKSGPLHLIR